MCQACGHVAEVCQVTRGLQRRKALPPRLIEGQADQANQLAVAWPRHIGCFKVQLGVVGMMTGRHQHDSIWWSL